jgi:hypothetical protein
MVAEKQALYKSAKRVGLDAKAHLINLYPNPLSPGTDVRDRAARTVRWRRTSLSLSVIGSRGRVGLGGGVFLLNDINHGVRLVKESRSEGQAHLLVVVGYYVGVA